MFGCRSAYDRRKKVLTIMPNKCQINAMPKYIRKVKHDLTAFRVAIPAALISELAWESCRYVTVERHGHDAIIVKRMPGDEKREREGSGRVDGFDRSTGGAG